MSEFILELYSEEIPPNLQVNVRTELKKKFENFLKEESLKYKGLYTYSTPTRLTVFIEDIPEKIKIPEKELKGPKVGVMDDVLNAFVKAQNITKKEIFVKENDKGKFYFAKIKAKETLTSNLLIKISLNSIASLNWKKSMKWSDKNLLWGRPLRSIMAIFNKKNLAFTYGHLKSKSNTVIETDLKTKSKIIKNFAEYNSFLTKNIYPV